MRKFLFILIICVIGYSKSYYQELYELTDKQKEILLYSLKKGKEKDLSYTLAAIAWKETNFGKKVINSKDGKHGSFCTYQILLSTAAARRNYNLKNENEVKELKNKLLNDLDFCSDLALEELSYWKNRFKGNYSKYIAGYNAGFKSISNPRGDAYQKDVRIRVKALVRYVQKNNIVY